MKFVCSTWYVLYLHLLQEYKIYIYIYMSVYIRIIFLDLNIITVNFENVYEINIERKKILSSKK